MLYDKAKAQAANRLEDPVKYSHEGLTRFIDMFDKIMLFIVQWLPSTSTNEGSASADLV